MLQARVDEFKATVLRIRRFALQGALPAEHPMAGKDVLHEVRKGMLDGCPEVLVNMLLAVRVHLTLIFEAIIECERQQREDTHVNLNLPFTKHACKVTLPSLTPCTAAEG